MNLFFSICSNNYLAQATVLGRSLKKFHPKISFFLFLCDKKQANIDYSVIADEVIEAESIEPRFLELSEKYNIIELNTCIKPSIFEYLFLKRSFDQIIYLDPDIQVFHSMSNLFEDFKESNLLLTPHIYSPIPSDGKKPDEEIFLIYGIYNLGFISIRHSEESMRFLRWWKERTFENGFIDTYRGFFVDQLPINLAPVFFQDVHVLKDPGLNMAPWNLHERWLGEHERQTFVNKIFPLKFFHFSSFKPGNPPLLPENSNTRYTMEDRPDLLHLYTSYNEELVAAGYMQYRNIPGVFGLKKKSKMSGIRKFLP